jgi:hypothetical protein
VCEGATEIGILRGINFHRIENAQKNMALQGIRYADGGGDNQFERTKAFFRAGYRVCLLCDSDKKETDKSKIELRALGVTIVDCEENNSSENQIFKDLDWFGVIELIESLDFENNDSDLESLKVTYRNLGYGDLPIDWWNTDTPQIRDVLGKTAKKYKWYKRIDYGENLGKVCCNKYSKNSATMLNRQLFNLFNWIDNV